MQARQSLKRVLSGGVAIAALLSGTTMLAMPAGAQGIEEIVVTAQKREERLFDVPLTITAYDQDFLNRVGVDALDELSDFVPGVQIQLQSPNNPGYVIRGITSDDGDFQTAPRISIFLNGVDVSRSRGSAFEIYDLERVEIVKGPQATLFGTAAAIGAVSVTTARPQQELAAEAYASYGNDDYYKLGGFVTGGTEFIQGRLALQYRKRDGYVENIAGDPGSQSAGGPVQDDLQGVDTFAIRPSLRFTPSENLTVDAILNYERNEPPGTAFRSGVIAPTGGTTDPFSFGELPGAFANFAGTPFEQTVRTALGGDELGLERDVWDFNLQAEYRLDDRLTVTGIYGYREFNSLEIFEGDGSQVPLLEANEDTQGSQNSYELRLNFEGERFRGFVGGSYFEEEGFQRSAFALDETIFAACLATGQGGIAISPTCVNPDGSFNRFVLLPPVPPSPFPRPAIVPANQAPPILSLNEFTNTADHSVWSLFGDVTYDVTDQLSLTAGVRWVNEKRESALATRFPDSVFQPGQKLLQGFSDTGGVPVTASGDFDDVLFRFNGLYRISPEWNVYATISEGRRSPVLRITQSSAGTPNPVELLPAEELWNYEIGTKAALFDGRLRLDAALYYQQYENFQVTVILPGAGLITNQSTGEATNLGFEAGFQAALTPQLSLFGTFAYIDAEIDDDPANGIFAGNTFRLTPEYSTSLAIDYTQPVVRDIEAFGTLSWTWRSEVFFEEENAPRAGVPIRDDSAGEVDLRAGLQAADGTWQIMGFVENLFDEEFLIDGGNTGGAFGAPTLIPGPDRFYGIEVRTRF